MSLLDKECPLFLTKVIFDLLQITALFAVEFLFFLLSYQDSLLLPLELLLLELDHDQLDHHLIVLLFFVLHEFLQLHLFQFYTKNIITYTFNHIIAIINILKINNYIKIRNLTVIVSTVRVLLDIV